MNWTKWFRWMTKEPEPKPVSLHQAREDAATLAYDTNSRSSPSPTEFLSGKADDHPWVKDRPIVQHKVLDENGEPLPEDDPLARAVNRSWATGETVIWNEGDPLP